MIEVAAFQKALGLALGFNTTFPFKYGRYGRFERNVLGPNATDEQKAELGRRVDAFVSAARHQADVTKERKIYDNPAGFMRTDALTRIGNQVFASNTNIDDNYAVADSPVRFPQIWDASWFNWVQYNSSIADPLARNIGEALGVRAVAKLYGPDAGEFENSINMAGLRALEICSPVRVRSRASRRRNGRRCFPRWIRRRSRPAPRSTRRIASDVTCRRCGTSRRSTRSWRTTRTISRRTGGRARTEVGTSRWSTSRSSSSGPIRVRRRTS
jgi:hypothetical protein